MHGKPLFSIIVPVYNRPDEVNELLQSLTAQTNKNFEIILVDDGSTQDCKTIAEKYSFLLPLHYFFKPNEGPGPTRNYGIQKAKGLYFVFFDSDCLIPPHYFSVVEHVLNTTPCDMWGGPDRAHGSFSVKQQTMAFTMTSFFLTGGIRGSKQVAKNYQPRSFNMGFHRQVYETVGGFGSERIAEDSLLSIRIRQAKFSIQYVHEAFVYHKRRATWKKFWRQVFIFGKGRAQIGRQFPEEVSLFHWVPSCYLLFVVALPFLLLINRTLFLIGIGAWLFYFLLIALEAAVKKQPWRVCLQAIPSAFIQLTGYGYGFLKEKIFPDKNPERIRT